MTTFNIISIIIFIAGTLGDYLTSGGGEANPRVGDASGNFSSKKFLIAALVLFAIGFALVLLDVFNQTFDGFGGSFLLAAGAIRIIPIIHNLQVGK